MSARSSRGGLAMVLILAVGLYLAYRSWEAVQLVQTPPRAPVALGAERGDGPVGQALRSDEMVAAVNPGGRDPMHAKPRARGPITRTAPEPQKETPPALRMVLVDRVSPVIQVSIDGTLSGRLKVGDSFRGWVVEQISSGSAVVIKGDERVSISLRRAQ